MPDSSDTLSSPVYQFPMPDEALVIIGRITLMWGQLDSQIDQILMSLYRLTPDQFDGLFGGKMVGPKVEALKTGLPKARNDNSREKIRNMLAAVSRCVTDRNTMTHGFWGWEWVNKRASWTSMAFSRSKNRYFYLEDLTDLHERVAEACREADIAWHAEIMGTPAPPNMNRRFLVSEFPPDALPFSPPNYVR